MLKRLIVSLSTLLLLPPLLLLVLLGTQGGSRWFLDVLPEWLPASAPQLQIVHHRGTLLGPLEIERLAVSTEQMRFEATSLTIRWSPRALFAGVLALDQISVGSLDIEQRSGAQASSDTADDTADDTAVSLLPIAIDLDSLTIDALQLSAGTGQARVSNVAATASINKQFAFDAALGWRAIEMPIPGLATDQWGEADIVLSGDIGRVAIDALALAAPLGRLQATGTIQWRDVLDWQLNIAADAVNPDVAVPGWPGTLSAQVVTSGQVDLADGGGAEAVFELTRLEGDLRDQPVVATGLIRLANQQLELNQVAMRSGENRFGIDGMLGSQFDLRYQLDAPDLGALMPGFAGVANGNGVLSGTLKAPVLIGRLQIQDGVFNGQRIGGLDLEADWSESGGDVQIAIDDAVIGSQTISEATISILGTPISHQLQFAASSNDRSVQLTAHGGYQSARWQGAIDSLELVGSPFGQWMLASAAPLVLSPTDVSATSLCLSQQPALVCFNGGWDVAEGLAAEASIRSAQLDALADWLPAGTSVIGVLAGDVQIDGTLENPSARWRLRAPTGSLSWREDEQTFSAPFQNLRIEGDYRDDVAVINTGLDLAADGEVDAALRIAAAADDGARGLDGEIRGSFKRLDALAGLINVVDSVRGQFAVDVSLSGTLSAPKLQGYARLSEGGARISATGAVLTDIALSLEGDDSGRLNIDGTLAAGRGTASVFGSVNLENPLRPVVDLTMVGRDLMLVDMPDASLVLSPDVRIVGASNYQLSGDLQLPQGHLTLRELPESAVSVSADQVIAGDAKSADSGLSLDADITLTLGESVQFSGFGLETGLTGSLRAVVAGEGLRLDGGVNLSNATYTAYGQDLRVEQGRLLFRGVPDNPGVDLSAYRLSRDESVKAYIAIDGFLSDPLLRVYSEPPLPEAEALAYLLTGRGMDSASRSEGTDIASAALALGMARSDPYLQRLGGKFGFDQLSLETRNGDVETSSLVVGKYLNPDLYVGYSQGLFSPEGTVLLRLRLSDRLEIESRSGAEQSADVFYRLERH